MANLKDLVSTSCPSGSIEIARDPRYSYLPKPPGITTWRKLGVSIDGFLGEVGQSNERRQIVQYRMASILE